MTPSFAASAIASTPRSSETISLTNGSTSIAPRASRSSAGANLPQRDPMIVISSTTTRAASTGLVPWNVDLRTSVPLLFEKSRARDRSPMRCRRLRRRRRTRGRVSLRLRSTRSRCRGGARWRACDRACRRRAARCHSPRGPSRRGGRAFHRRSRRRARPSRSGTARARRTRRRAARRKPPARRRPCRGPK